MEVNQTIQQLNETKGKVPPGNILRMMGKQTPTKATPPKQSQVSTVRWSVNTADTVPTTTTATPTAPVDPAPVPDTPKFSKRGNKFVTRPTPKDDGFSTWGAPTGNHSVSSDDDDLDFY